MNIKRKLHRLLLFLSCTLHAIILISPSSILTLPHCHSAAPASQPAAPVSSAGAGEQQPSKCRDPIFALILLGNVAAIAAVAGIYGTTAFDQTVNNGGYNYNGYIAAAFILGAIAMIFTGLCLPIMMCIPEMLIKASLIGMLILAGAMMVISFITGNIIGGIFGLVFFLIFCCYARAGTFMFIMKFKVR
jgi:hypothetical protein